MIPGKRRPPATADAMLSVIGHETIPGPCHKSNERVSCNGLTGDFVPMGQFVTMLR